MKRVIKRIIIVGVFFFIVAAVSFPIYWVKKPRPTCFDGKRNQGEEKVDCGGPCNACPKEIKVENLEVVEKTYVSAGEKKYDLMARVRNPNGEYGSSSFAYQFVLKDGNGSILAKEEGKSFILPSETKYVLKINVEVQSEQAPANVDFIINETEWKHFFDYEKPQLNIYHKRYNLVSSGIGFSEAFGLLRNESKFDFDVILINVVLRDSLGKPVAMNMTQVMMVNAGEERDFRVFWPSSFSGDVVQVEMEAETNVFNSDNFVKKYLK